MTTYYRENLLPSKGLSRASDAAAAAAPVAHRRPGLVGLYKPARF